MPKLSEIRSGLIAKVTEVAGVDTWFLEPPDFEGEVAAFIPPMTKMVLFPSNDLVYRATSKQEIYLGFRYDRKAYKDLPIGSLEGFYFLASLIIQSWYGSIGVNAAITADTEAMAVQEYQRSGYLVYLCFSFDLGFDFEPETPIPHRTIQGIDLDIYRRALNDSSDSLVLQTRIPLSPSDL